MEFIFFLLFSLTFFLIGVVIKQIRDSRNGKTRGNKAENDYSQSSSNWYADQFSQDDTPNTDINENDEEYIRNHHLNETYQDYCQRIRMEEVEREQSRRKLSACYSTLKISSGASDDDIKHAYHNLVLRYHPDNVLKPDSPDDIKELVSKKFTVIQQAYTEICKARGIR